MGMDFSLGRTLFGRESIGTTAKETKKGQIGSFAMHEEVRQFSTIASRDTVGNENVIS